AKRDRLVNNAGILRGEPLDAPDFDSIRQQLEVNALGPLRVVAALRHRLGEGGKIALISSRMGLPGPTRSSGGNYGYRMSKAALNVAGVALARDLKRDGIAVALLHPGWVQTSMTRGKGSLTPQKSARGLVERIDALTLQETGGFWNVDGERLPW
ncbi:MAG: SDR family NAD(P)-dependent oxidoreductase, partial [Myxococcales bacterium]|nr:SDR family NAD(P)-dependent oxidoreductase [Myxococcales bacterium]